MTIHKVEVSTDKKLCVQCKKMKAGCYRKLDGNYICYQCIMKNIDKLKSEGNAK